MANPRKKDPMEPVRRPAANARHNWDACRTYYVEGEDRKDGHWWPTLGEAGEKYGIPPGMVRQRAAPSVEAWAQAQDLFKAKLEDARQQKKATVLAARAATFDGASMKIAEALLEQVTAHLRKSAEEKAPLSEKILRGLAAVLRDAQFSGRLAMGDTTEFSKLAGNLTREFDLSALTDSELADLERLRNKMDGRQ